MNKKEKANIDGLIHPERLLHPPVWAETVFFLIKDYLETEVVEEPLFSHLWSLIELYESGVIKIGATKGMRKPAAKAKLAFQVEYLVRDGLTQDSAIAEVCHRNEREDERTVRRYYSEWKTYVRSVLDAFDRPRA